MGIDNADGGGGGDDISVDVSIGVSAAVGDVGIAGDGKENVHKVDVSAVQVQMERM